MVFPKLFKFADNPECHIDSFILFVGGYLNTGIPTI